MDTPLLQLDYDYGLYSDPLHQLPPAATGVTEQTITIDGLIARLVRFSAPASLTGEKSGGSTPMHFIGLHIAQVLHTPMGFQKLTVMAKSADPAQLQQVISVLTSIRFIQKML